MNELNKKSKDWLAKYYPVPAENAFRGATRLAMVEHALKKWLGLREKVLKEHGLVANGCDVREGMYDRKVLRVNSDSCVLCLRYIDKLDCRGCPLTLVRDRNRPCDDADGAMRFPFDHWIFESNPEPMIKLLRKARRHLLKKA